MKCWTLADHVHKSVVCHTLIYMYMWQKMAKLRLIYIGLSLDDTGVSQQMAFISGQSLHPFSQHIFKMLQDLAAAEIQLVTHTHKRDVHVHISGRYYSTVAALQNTLTILLYRVVYHDTTLYNISDYCYKGLLFFTYFSKSR